MNPAIQKKLLLALGIAANVISLGYCASGGGADEPSKSSPPRARAMATVAVWRLAPNTLTPKLTSYFSPQFDQTEVYPAEDLVLVDEPGRRLLLSPIYSVRGGREPSVVNLRLYSFTDESLYDGGEGLALAADGREVWASPDALYSYNVGERGGVIEHLGGAVPFEQFVVAVWREDVSLIVGREEIRLSRGQLQALRNMARCGKYGACE